MNKKMIILITILVLGLTIYFLIQNNKLFYKCPANEEKFDCMPSAGIGRSSKFCAPDYRHWIEKNCQGIKFTY